MKPAVLVVDDSLTVRMDLAEALEEAGFEAFPCADLASAERHLDEPRLALVVLDVLLPDGSGVDFLRQLRAHRSAGEVPVMLLSTEVDVKSRVEGMRAGADEYVGKPYDIAQIVARARAIARRPVTGAMASSVLVIDDSRTFREELVEQLSAAGYRVLQAGTGEEGLALAAATRPQAVVVDGILPGIDGATVIRRLTSDAVLRGTPCVLMTASEGAADELQALEAGADAYFAKSESFDIVLARLAALLRGERAAASPLPPAASMLTPKRVLAIDDSPTYLDALGTQLQREGYDVVLARSGEEGLELLASQPVDCILLDLVMPGLSGEETCRRIKQSLESRDIPLIMVTSLDDRAAMLAGINAGADDFVAKGNDFEILKARLRAQLRRTQFETEHRRVREELVRRQSERQAEEQLHAYALALEQRNRELEEARERAEQESRFKSRFLANMSHELRTPLNAVIGFSELLVEGTAGPLSAMQGEFVSNVLQGGRHLLALVNDILDLSRVAAGRLKLERGWHPLGDVLEAARSLAQPLLRGRNQTLAIELDAAVPLLWIDPLRIRQVVFNFVSNAIKFSPPGSAIQLNAALEEGHVHVRCIDHGIGIAAADLPRLFQEFERIESGASAGIKGTGLGLALSRQLVELHGGSVDVTSTPGQGSTFSFALALAETTEEQSAELPATVLVSTDDARAADELCRHLRSLGLSATVGRDVGDVLRLARLLQPGVIAIGHGRDEQVLRAALAAEPRTAEIPIVALTDGAPVATHGAAIHAAARARR
ncbi:MAG TPA: response regulator [Kofleriaceae bacterium]|nr:response regulator [Kofleriaceae bacterium]